MPDQAKKTFPFQDLPVTEDLFCTYCKPKKERDYQAHKDIYRNILIFKEYILY